MSGQLFVVSAASGTGKTSLVTALVQEIEKTELSVSYTTRAPRPNEEQGAHYHFVSEACFSQMQDEGDLLESAEIYGYHYGTSLSWVQGRLEAGIDVVLEIDWQGGLQVKKSMPEACLIFIIPPSIEVLKARLVARRQDDKDVIKRRLQGALEEIAHHDAYDYLLMNDDFDLALSELACIIKAHRLLNIRQKLVYKDVLKALINQ